ncbi:MAG: hypothetical protein QOF84_4502 [Streptomyces sp.]|nr:hypothetical protein [Streptomyces sp.]MDX6349712.1 hypothetical protein [Streptomyces sp.]
MLVRPLRDDEEDAEAVRVVSAAAFGSSRVFPVPEDPGRAARHRERYRHLARTDPGGCWLGVDEVSGMPVGAALSLRREGTWGLSTFVVLPEAQGRGVGRELLAAAMVYGRGCLRGIICGSRDPRAAATYRRAGFALHPAMLLTGPVDKARLPAPDGPVHEGSAKHRDLMDSVARRTRGGAHGPDHDQLLRDCALLVVDDLAGSGYCYLRPDGRVELLAATSRRLATRLLTAALLTLPDGTPAYVSNLTADQQWALDVGLTAGLDITNAGYICLRGMRPPAPYVPSGAFL